MALGDFINKSFDLSRQRTAGYGGQATSQAVGLGSRIAGARGLGGAMGVALPQIGATNVRNKIQDALAGLEIKRNQSLASGQQFQMSHDLNRELFDFQKQQYQTEQDMARRQAEQGIWGSIWSGLGGVLGGIAGGPIGASIGSALGNLGSQQFGNNTQRTISAR